MHFVPELCIILYIINPIGEFHYTISKKMKKENHLLVSILKSGYRQIQILIDTGKDLTLINFKFETRIREFVPRVRIDQWQGWLLAVARSYLLDHAANDDHFISILITRED